MRAFIFIIIISCTSLAWGENIEWYLGKTIDCPIAVSLPSKPLPRTVVIPGGAVTDAPSYWDENQLHVQIIRNTVILHLRDPGFEGTMSIYDDKGNLYLLRVHAAPNNQEPDQTLVLRPALNPPPGIGGNVSGSVPSEMRDSDAAITAMMLHMVGGPQHSQIAGSLVTSVRDGKIVPGRVIFSDDMMSIEVYKAYQGPTTRGCECLLRYLGTKPVRLNTEHLWFPGVLAVYADDQTALVPGRPGVDVQPKSVIRLFYVYDR